MGYQRFTIGPKLTQHDWPLQLTRGAMAEGFAPGKDFVLNASAVHNYFFRNPEDRIQYALTNADLVSKHGMVPQASDASDAFDAMIVASYREGVELYRVLGQQFTTIKLAGADAAKASALRAKFQRLPVDQLTSEHEDHHRLKIERDGGNAQRREMPKPYSMNEEHLAGCLHVMEMMQAMRAQASAALLADEGVMPRAQYQQVIDQSYDFLAAQGHMGPYALAKAHPGVDAFLRADKRKIVVSFSRDREAFPDVMTSSHFTRAAYFNSEKSHLDASKWIKREDYMRDNTYPQAMGEWYLKAFQQKAAAAAKAAQGHVLANHDMTLQSLTDLPPFFSTGAESSQYDNFKRASRAYVGKHGIALMQPEIVGALEKAGKFTPANSFALDHAFHHGYNPPYLTHIHDLCVRLNGQSRAAQAAGAPGGKLLPRSKAPDALPAPDKKLWGTRALENRMGRGKGEC
jgi:hypothetical protein